MVPLPGGPPEHVRAKVPTQEPEDPVATPLADVTSSWRRRYSLSAADARIEITRQIVMASAPGGTGPPIKITWDPRRTTCTPRR